MIGEFSVRNAKRELTEMLLFMLPWYSSGIAFLDLLLKHSKSIDPFISWEEERLAIPRLVIFWMDRFSGHFLEDPALLAKLLASKDLILTLAKDSSEAQELTEIITRLNNTSSSTPLLIDSPLSRVSSLLKTKLFINSSDNPNLFQRKPSSISNQFIETSTIVLSNHLTYMELDILKKARCKDYMELLMNKDHTILSNPDSPLAHSIRYFNQVAFWVMQMILNEAALKDRVLMLSKFIKESTLKQNKKQNKTKQTKQNKTKPNQTKPNQTKPNKTKQKTKQKKI